jgi:hypothetical protein
MFIENEKKSWKGPLRLSWEIVSQQRNHELTTLSHFVCLVCVFQTIAELKREMGRAQTSNERLQAQLASECKTRSDVENRNTTLEHEMTKVRLETITSLGSPCKEVNKKS